MSKNTRFRNFPQRRAAGTALVCALFFFPACAKKTPKPEPSHPPSVATTVARLGRLQAAERLPGLIAPYQNVAIQSNLAEPAIEIDVAEGDRVAAGQTIARLDTADLEAQLAADLAQANSDAANATHTTYQGRLTIAQSDQSVNGARATLAQAQQTLAKDTIDLRRYQQLLGNGYISDQTVAAQVAQARNDAQAVRAAEASLASARESVDANGTLAGNGLQASAIAQARATQQVALAQADAIRTSIVKATIVSPIDGVVVNRNFNRGEYPGTRQLFTLQQVDPVYAVLRGSGKQIARITPGAAASITVSDVAAAPVRGTVIGVLNQINPGSTDFQVKVIVRNPRATLRPGMPVTGTVALPSQRGVKILTTAFTDDTHSAVLVVGRDAKVKTVRVAETASDGTAAIVTGLSAGSRVITDGQTSLGDGQTVAVR